MESPSEHQRRAVSPWRGLLITASILSCWIQPTSAQVTVVPNPPYGEVNRNVILDIGGFSGWVLTYTWYRKALADSNRIARYTVATGEQDPAGIREKVLPNGSLLIPDLTLSDTDDYHVTIVNSQGSIMVGQGHLTVYGLPDPTSSILSTAQPHGLLPAGSHQEGGTSPGWPIFQQGPAAHLTGKLDWD
ncbi:cell adhesion molecule CEACAM2-like [Sarcophilus harrisii]